MTVIAFLSDARKKKEKRKNESHFSKKKKTPVVPNLVTIIATVAARTRL